MRVLGVICGPRRLGGSLFCGRQAACLLLAVFWLGAAGAGAAGEQGPKPGVEIKNGRFFDRATGEAFVPRGFNLVRLFPQRSHNSFDPQHYDSAAAEKALQRWKSDGFNAVRVFINAAAQLAGTIAQKSASGLEPAYVRNAADFLMRARAGGMRVMLCTESFPRVAPYAESCGPLPKELSAPNGEYLDAGRVQAKARFLKDLITALRTARPECLEAVLSYDLQNELCFHGSAPFTLDAGTLAAANGKTYDLAGQRQEMADEAAVYFINRMADAIHEVHPLALVSASVFTYAAVGKTGPGDFTVEKAGWKNRFPFRPLAILRSKADFLDLHFYSSNAANWERDLASVEFAQVQRLAGELGKPLFAGEFGAFKRAFPTVEPAAAWMRGLVQRFNEAGFAGWLYWTYDTHEQNEELWHACDHDSAIYNALRSTLR